MERSEKGFLEDIKKGSEKAFRDLFNIYYQRLFCIARQYVRDDFIAETIVGDLFYHIWENRKSLEIHISLNAYLIRSIRNYSLNYLQKNFVKNEVDLNSISPLLLLDEEYPLGILIEKELTEKIKDEIEKLPLETRRVFTLSRMEELKNEEIAHKLNISINTVKYHIKQALSILRVRFKDYLIFLLPILIRFF